MGWSRLISRKPRKRLLSRHNNLIMLIQRSIHYKILEQSDIGKIIGNVYLFDTPIEPKFVAPEHLDAIHLIKYSQQTPELKALGYPPLDEAHIPLNYSRIPGLEQYKGRLVVDLQIVSTQVTEPPKISAREIEFLVDMAYRSLEHLIRGEGRSLIQFPLAR